MVLSKTDNDSYLDKEMTFNINRKGDYAKMYVVKVSTNQGSNIKKIISSQ